MHGCTDNGQKVFAIAHPEHSSNELKQRDYKTTDTKHFGHLGYCIEIVVISCSLHYVLRELAQKYSHYKYGY